MGRRCYHYQIEVFFDKKRSKCQIGTIDAEYVNSGDNKDSFHFMSDKMVLVAFRSKKYIDGQILSNNQNSIYTQLLKGLLFYYSMSEDFPTIKEIEITRKYTRLKDYNYLECNSDIIQPIISSLKKTLFFDKSKIEVLFEETTKGAAIRIALSYWLKGVASTERYYKFEHLWKAYDRLFMYHGNLPKGVDCMIVLRTLIIDNESLFLESKAITNAYCMNDLRRFRWRNCILNDYNTPNKTEAFKNFILRYHDSRIMNLFSSILPYREANLNSIDLSRVRNHISTHLTVSSDIELVTLLSLKYAYYVRNKMFHGEIPDSTFKVHETNEDFEIDKLNELLSALIFELLNNNCILR
jgi:hypothetical protein